jgi:uncharacterized protein YndB with AHSA1/START domain
MTRTQPVTSVRLERVIAAPPDRVFAAWIDPDLMARWMSPVGRSTAEVEPWVGGRLRVLMIGDDVRIEHRGEYLEIVPDRLLVFTWRSPYTGPGSSVVTVRLEPTEAGTVLTLIHERLPRDQVEPHQNGWGWMLDRLVTLLAAARVNGGR